MHRHPQDSPGCDCFLVCSSYVLGAMSLYPWHKYCGWHQVHPPHCVENCSWIAFQRHQRIDFLIGFHSLLPTLPAINGFNGLTAPEMPYFNVFCMFLVEKAGQATCQIICRYASAPPVMIHGAEATPTSLFFAGPPLIFGTPLWY